MVRKRCGEIVGLQFIQPLVRCYLFGGKCLLKKERLLETLFGKNNGCRAPKVEGMRFSFCQPEDVYAIDRFFDHFGFTIFWALWAKTPPPDCIRSTVAPAVSGPCCESAVDSVASGVQSAAKRKRPICIYLLFCFKLVFKWSKDQAYFLSDRTQVH